MQTTSDPRPSGDALVRVSGLHKTYGSYTALRDVSFTIERGETLALLGPNGAGKSTTIEILEGYRTRTSGEVEVLGRDPEKAGLDWRAELGIVLQSTGESGNATVREQLRHFAALYPNPRDVDETIEAVGLAAKAGSRIRTLSGGQQRRVDVALGIIGRPALLFLDEPTTGFDAEARRDFWTLIKGLTAEGTTILLTTHYMEEAANLASRAVVIAGGGVVADAPLDRLGGPDARVPVVHWTEGGTAREQRTDDPGRFVADLYARLGEPQDLEVVRPGLEDIYLGLVSAAHPDAKIEAAA